MKKLFSKIFIGYLLTIVILSLLILYFTNESISEHYFNSLTGELTMMTNTIRHQAIPYIKNKNYSGLDSLIKLSGNENHVRITIIDTTGKVIADSKSNPAEMDNHLNRPEIQQAKYKGFGKSVRFSNTISEDMMYVAKSINIDNQILGYARLSYFLRDVNTLVDELTSKIRNIVIIGVLLSILGVYIFARTITKPVKQLEIAADKISKGDFDIHVSNKNHDEIGLLADSFNHMTKQIKKLFNEVSIQNDELAGIIESLQVGFIVFNFDGKVLLSNSAFKSIVNNNVVEGKNIIEVLHYHSFQKFVSKLQKQKEFLSLEIEYSGKIYYCTGNFIQGKNEMIVAMNDISELKRLEKIKKDLIVNVSHELRTPLTAIKGFVETLEDDEIDESRLHYLEIIHNHTNRLIAIVNDLLLLSNMEETSSKLDISEVDLKQLAGRVLLIFEQKLRDKGLSIQLTVDENVPLIKADAFKIEQVFINLIDNGLKYTDNGSIEINIHNEDPNIKIEFIDSGIGIPKENLSRVFERFYTVDKSRSRKMGGTGLGLSIVKHIVMLHDGTINVESNYGSGSKFIVQLPINAKSNGN